MVVAGDAGCFSRRAISHAWLAGDPESVYPFQQTAFTKGTMAYMNLLPKSRSAIIRGIDRAW